MDRQRWPRWIYGSGSEPDYRFSLANERTFLAWVRTALAMMAGGVALDTFATDYSETATRVVASALVTVGLGCVLVGWIKWARTEVAVRREEPIGGMRSGLVLGTSTVLLGAALLFMVLSR